MLVGCGARPQVNKRKDLSHSSDFAMQNQNCGLIIYIFFFVSPRSWATRVLPLGLTRRHALPWPSVAPAASLFFALMDRSTAAVWLFDVLMPGLFFLGFAVVSKGIGFHSFEMHGATLDDAILQFF